MSIDSVRERLLQQHQTLRQKVGTLMAVTAPTDGPAAELDFRLALAELSDSLAQHNREEERLLSALVEKGAAADGRRLMCDHHAREHAAQLSALRSVVECSSFAAAIILVQHSLREILEHMAREERELLHSSVLNDETFALAPHDE